jgi:hypothetical protein
MAWKKGQSGNPAGRPPKEATLTAILSMRGGETVNFKPHARKVEKKQILAQRIWDALIYGYVDFPDGRREEINISVWLALVKWIHNRIDGLPPQALDVTSGAEPLYGGTVIILPSNGREIETPVGTTDAISE